MHAPEPYTRALQDLQEKYGQPRQLVQSDLGSILTSPPIKYGDAEAFDNFSLSVHSLVGMLKTLEGLNEYKLKYGSHVDRLSSKMPASYRDSFVEYCLTRGILQTSTDKTYALPDLAAGLHMKSQAKRIASRAADLYPESAPNPRKKEQSTTTRFKEKTTTIYLNKNQEQRGEGPSYQQTKKDNMVRPYCPYCDTKDHFLSACTQYKAFSTDQKVQ